MQPSWCTGALRHTAIKYYGVEVSSCRAGYGALVAPLGADRYDGSAIGKALPTGGGSFVGWQREAAQRLGVTPEPCLAFDDQAARTE